ncbi:MAG: hypothetical protein BGO63_07795 [Candidatus Accumulibacter sp. 66-26]|nr:MAG: hypothetical protein BGO63_07795 [Candidatus Accumulibacter sp. 66-26]
MLFHFPRTDLNSAFFEQPDGLNGIKSERAERILAMTPSIKYPIFTIVHQLLWRNDSSGTFLAAPVPIFQVQTLPIQ